VTPKILHWMPFYCSPSSYLGMELAADYTDYGTYPAA